MRAKFISQLSKMCILTFLALPAILNAQLTYKTSWIGNTFSGTNNKWVQDFSSDIDVASDGTVVSNSPWDENGRCNGIYKDGDVVGKLLGEQHGVGGCWCWGTAGKTVAVDEDYLYINTCEGDVVVYNRKSNYSFVKENAIGFEADGMFSKGTKLYLVNSGAVQIRTKSDMTLSGSFNVSGASDIAVDNNNTIWLLINDKIVHFTEDGIKLADTIILDKPTAINIDNKGRLIVCESGWKRQVFFYDITASPLLDQVLGQEGGLSAGTPGLVEPDKFFDLVGAGTDSLGNIYVAMSYRENIIRKFTPAGKQVWEVQALNFLDNVDAEASSDGKYIYGSDEIYEMDYTKPAGQQWKLKAITRDKVKYSFDKREQNQSTTSSFIRNINGHKLMFLTGQVSEGFYIYYFNSATDGEIAIPTNLIIGSQGWAKWADKYGNIWSCNNQELTIYEDKLIGFEGSGKPIYGAKTQYKIPEDFTTIQKIVYMADEDIMYLSGFTKTHTDPGGAWGTAGSVIARFDNWSKGPKLKYSFSIPFDTWPGGGGGDMVMPKSVAIAGDYIFVGYVWTDGTAGVNPPIHIYNNLTGANVGVIRPGNEVFTNGWIDIAFGINAFQRTNGEYVIFQEDGSRAKNIMYQWCPTGDCMESDIAIIVTSPTPNSYFIPTDDLTIKATATSNLTTISKVNFYANDSLLGYDDTEPYEFAWTNRPNGLFAIKAVAIGANGAQRHTIDNVPVTLGNGLPEITLLSPSIDNFYSVIDTIHFNVQVKDNGTIDSVQYYVNDKVWATLKNVPFDTVLIAPSAGFYTIKAKAYDNDLNSAETDTVTIQVFNAREPENPVSTKNGIFYSYYEGAFSNLPDFESLTPKDLGKVANFDISKRNVEDDFAFNFTGFINIFKEGIYTFYISSDDGSILFLGDSLFVNNDGQHGIQEKLASILLKPGKHAITVAFFEAGGGQSLDVSYSGPGISKTIIPDSVLYYETLLNNSAPQISIIDPSENLVVKNGDSLPISVQVYDAENNIMKVEYYSGQEIIGVGLAPNFGFTWKVKAVSDIILSAKVIDYDDLYSVSAPLNIEVNLNPLISIISPLNNKRFYLGDSIGIVANASDDGSISKVELYSNNALIETDSVSPYSFTIVPSIIGAYKLKAKAFDNTNLTSVSSVINVIVEKTTGIGSNNKQKISVYPNPLMDDKFMITGVNGETNVRIFDITGKMVYVKNYLAIDKMQISDIKLTSGFYNIQITNQKNVTIKKLVVQ